MSSVAVPVGRIGPNAIIRVGEVLLPMIGEAAARGLYERAGLAHYWAAPPEHMVDEAEVRCLHAELRQALGEDRARDVAAAAGRRTADYLLANRIPRAVQALLKRLPAGPASRVLLNAVTRHAWTFAGSGEFEARIGHPVVLVIRRNPLCQGLQSNLPACDFYAATFERLFQVLVHRNARARETACEACGDPECRFEIRWAAG